MTKKQQQQPSNENYFPASSKIDPYMLAFPSQSNLSIKNKIIFIDGKEIHMFMNYGLWLMSIDLCLLVQVILLSTD